jgi:hypothetical protein
MRQAASATDRLRRAGLVRVFFLLRIRAMPTRLPALRVFCKWEKKWHPEITDAKIALPHFTRWFRENWET